MAWFPNRSEIVAVALAAAVGVVLVAALVPSLVQANSVNSADQSGDSIDVYGTLPQATPSLTRVSPDSYSVPLDRNERKTFTVTAGDTDNDIRRYEWRVDNEIKSSHNYSIWVSAFGIGGWVGSSPDGSVTKSFAHTFGEEGTYFVQVVFYDKDHNETWLTWSVNVSNVAPTVTRNSPGSHTNLSFGEEETFEVTANDRGNRLKRYDWTVNGTSKKSYTWIVLPSGDKTETFEHSFDTPGRNTVTATFTDDYGSSRSTSWTVNVGSPPLPTVTSINCSPLEVPVGLTTKCSATFENAQPTRIKWTVQDSTTRVYSKIGNVPLDVEWASIGGSTNEWRKINVEGCIGTECGTLKTTFVRVTNYPPSARKVSISPEPDDSDLLKANQNYTFKADAFDDDDNLDTYQWYIDDDAVQGQGGNYSNEGSDVSFRRSFIAGETPEVRVTFTDDNDNRDSVTWDLTVNSPPEVTVSLDGDSSPTVSATVPQNFTVEAEDDDGNLAKWKWQIDIPGALEHYSSEVSVGSDRSSAEKTIPYTFPSGGAYGVIATFTDDYGATGSARLDVNVEDPPDPPNLAIEIAEQVTPIVGKPFSLPVTIANNGGSPSGPLRLIVAFGSFTLDGNINDDADVQANIEATSQFTIPGLNAGQTRRDTLSSATVTDDLDPGPRFLCVLTEYVNPTTDSDESDHRSCSLMYLLPDMGDAFPGGLQAFFHVDDQFQLGLTVDIDIEEIFQSSQATSFAGLGPVLGALASVVVGSIQESSFDYGSQSFWVFVPTKYSTGEPEELAEEIVERTTGGLEHREDRVKRYKKLALEIARRGQTYGNKFYSVGDTEEEKQKFLDGVGKINESTGDYTALGQDAVDAVEILHGVGEWAGYNMEPSDIVIFNQHLGHLSLDKVNGFLAGLSFGAKTASLVNDIRITESLNRTIHRGQALKTLAALEKLRLEDVAWQMAIEEAKAELDDMTSPDGLNRWSSAVEQNLPNIVATYADLALKLAVKKAAAFVAGKAVASIGILAGAPVAVVALPITIVAVLTIDQLYKLKDETDKFWDGVTMAGMSTQVYSHVHRRLGDSGLPDSERQALEEIRDYLKFAYYKHLGRAAESDPEFAFVDVGIWGDGKLTHDIVRSERNSIFHERDEILSKAFGGNWDHPKDIKFPVARTTPFDIWSNESTLWVIRGEAVFSSVLDAYSLLDSTPSEDKQLNFVRYGMPVTGNAPRGFWSDGHYVWILDTENSHVLSKFDSREPLDPPILEISSGEDSFEDLAGGIWSDKKTMWLTSNGECAILAFDFNTRSRDRSKDICYLDEDNNRPFGIWSDGQTMWVSDIDDGKIYAYSVRFGDPASSEPTKIVRDPSKEITTVKVKDVSEEDLPPIADNSTPTGIWSNGHTMWVADRDSGRIFAYTLPDSLSSPLNLTATVSGSGADSQVGLLWEVPSDTGRTTITGYAVQVSPDGIDWSYLTFNTGSSSTNYYDGRSLEWNVHFYRVAAINSAGAGPWSSIATAYQNLTIDAITCSPEQFYVGDSVDCSPAITTASTAEFTYAWEAQDATVTPSEDGSSTSVAWDPDGAKDIYLVACSEGDASDYIYAPWDLVGANVARVEIASEGACAEATQTIQVADVVPSIYFQNPRSPAMTDPIGVGDTFDLEFEVGRKTWVGGPGGITVSFPDLMLDNSVNSGSYYGSDEGRVRTDNLVTTLPTWSTSTAAAPTPSKL